MGIWIDAFIYCFGPIIVLGSLIGLIQWVQDRFGADPFLEHQESMSSMFKGIFDYFPKPPQRESKATPHYDAFVDAEWRALRLEEALDDAEDSDEAASLIELLERKR